MSEAGRKQLSESCKGRVPWNKGLTKADPRVLKNINTGGRKTQFKPGPRPETKGENNPSWKGGRIIHRRQGYVYILLPEHPYAKNKYVQEHRLVMEKKLGRYLLPHEIVHHINHNRQDNREENLLLMNSSEHSSIHSLERWSTTTAEERTIAFGRVLTICLICKAPKYFHKNQTICKSCMDKGKRTNNIRRVTLCHRLPSLAVRLSPTRRK